MFGARLKRLRETQGLSMERLAEQCGLHKSTIYRMEAGVIEPSLTSLKALAAGLGMTVGALVDESTAEESLAVLKLCAKRYGVPLEVDTGH